MSIQVKNIEETIDYILENNCSVSRFGDGEMDIISGKSIPYQSYNQRLAEELEYILSLNSSKEFLVCLSDVFEDLDRYNDNFHYFWQTHKQTFAPLYQKVCTASWYGSTFISRPYIDLKDKSQSTLYFSKLKQLWYNKDILIVEGKTSRSGVGNDLFTDAKSIQRIICPSFNAFDQYDDIFEKVKQYGKNKLILLMLGPTAKVLAYYLSQQNYHAIDIGHIDTEYEWFLMGATHKVKLDYKHTAEFNYDDNIIFVENEKYTQEIIYNFVDFPNKTRIDFAFAANEKYAIHLGSTIMSLFEQHQSYLIHIHVLYKDLSLTIIEELKMLETLGSIYIHFHQINYTDSLAIPIRTEQFPIESFFRMLLPDILPHIDKVLYLDVDILIKKPLNQLFELDMDTYEIGAVVEKDIYAYYQWYLDGLGFSKYDKYFSSGVLLMHLKQMRENNTSDKLIAIARKTADSYKFPDQDILNVFYKHNFFELSKQYNYTDCRKIDKELGESDICIEHFNGDIKPWHALNQAPNYLKYSMQQYHVYREKYYNLFEKDAVSIVVLDNAEKDYLNYCIKTILEQSYPYLNIIVVTTKNDLDFLDKRIKIVQQAEVIITTEIIDSMTTPYITFVKADGWLDNYYIEKLLNTMKQTQAQIALTSFTELDNTRGVYLFRNEEFSTGTILQAKSVVEVMHTMNYLEHEMFLSLYGKLYLTEHVKVCVVEKEVSAEKLAYLLMFMANTIGVSEHKKYVVRTYGKEKLLEQDYMQKITLFTCFLELLYLANYNINPFVDTYRKQLKDWYDIALEHEYVLLEQMIVSCLDRIDS